MEADALLEKLGLKYEDLNAIERETYTGWLSALQKGAVSVERIRDFVAQLRDGVEEELASYESTDRKDIYLKARLRNLKLLEAMLMGPERAKKALEQALKR